MNVQHLPDRQRVVIGLLALYMIIGIGLRVALLVATPGHTIGACAFALSLGLFNDALVGIVLLAPVAALLALSGGQSLSRDWWRLTVLTSISGAALFGALVEFYFFEEFTARFNHIVVDYLLFPGEVATNVWQSYNVPLFLVIAAACGILTIWPIHRWLRGATFIPVPIARRLRNAFLALAIGVLTIAVLRAVPSQPSGDRMLDEIAANGLRQLVRAFATAHLDYQAYYHTLARDEARGRVAAELGWPDHNQPVRQFTAAIRRERPLDVVIVLEESLGSEFVGRLGSNKASTPHLDRWSAEGLLLTNLVATGNRTVRGLEGVLCSFPPLPGDSIWKREKSENVASIARILRGAGYHTEFLYGGAGTFDGMKTFALANGWDHFVEDGLIGSDFPKDAFRTAWGVADQYVFDTMLDHQRQAKKEGKPFFGTLMSTSNHKPFLTPDTADPRRSMKKMIKWGGIGLGLLALIAVIWWFGSRRVGRLRLGLVCGVLLVGYGVWLNVKLQPKDSRIHAVRYADRALGDYLDRARSEGILDHTVVLIVGDHGARVYGSEEIPAASYRIPALFIAPDPKLRGGNIDRLCSQVDLAPTLLSIAGVDYRAPFFGQDLLAQDPDGPGRAWLIHNRNIGLLTDKVLVVLGLQKTVTWYSRADRSSDHFIPVAPEAADDALRDLTDRAGALFQCASELYEGRRYVIPDGK